MLNHAIDIAFGLLGLAVVFTLIRLALGPDMLDRVLALDTLYVNSAAMLVLYGLSWAPVATHEAALLIAMLGFVDHRRAVEVHHARRRHRIGGCVSTNSWLEAIVSALVLIGAVFTLIGSLGLLRMPDFFTRLHGPSKATTIGIGSLLVASALFMSYRGGGSHCTSS